MARFLDDDIQIAKRELLGEVRSRAFWAACDHSQVSSEYPVGYSGAHAVRFVQNTGGRALLPAQACHRVLTIEEPRASSASTRILVASYI